METSLYILLDDVVHGREYQHHYLGPCVWIKIELPENIFCSGAVATFAGSIGQEEEIAL